MDEIMIYWIMIWNHDTEYWISSGQISAQYFGQRIFRRLMSGRTFAGHTSGQSLARDVARHFGRTTLPTGFLNYPLSNIILEILRVPIWVKWDKGHPVRGNKSLAASVPNNFHTTWIFARWCSMISSDSTSRAKKNNPCK